MSESSPQQESKMGIFTQEPTPARGIQEGCPRDMVTADQYGKRATRYEHEDIVLSNEYVAMIGHIDRTIEDLIAEVSKLTDYANALKQALHTRVIDLTVMVQREKAVVVDLQGHFQDLHTRIAGKRNEMIPTARSNGNPPANSEPAVTAQEEAAVVNAEIVINTQVRGKAAKAAT